MNQKCCALKKAQRFPIFHHMKKVVCFLPLLFFFACNGSETEKRQNKRDKIVEVDIRPIPTDDGGFISGHASLHVLNEYLIILDGQAFDNYVHIYDRDTYRYITRAIKKGRGPGEAVTGTFLETDEQNCTFLLTDFGKLSVFAYNIDSLVADPFHLPWVKTEIRDGRKLPVEYTYLNDTLSIGLLLEAIGNSDYSITLSRMNFQTGDMVPMPYEHPKITRKRIAYAVSKENGLIVEAYNHHDLITILDLDGNLLYNVYGNGWETGDSNETLYADGVAFCRDKIVVSFSGEERVEDGTHSPTKFHVFELNGDYVKTLETGYPIVNFCYDPQSHRILMALDGEMQFAYLDLEGLIY